MRNNCVSSPQDQEDLNLEEHLSPGSSHPPNTVSGSDGECIPFDPTVFEKLLQHECRMWQQKLRLQDWNIKVVLCRLHEMPDNNAIGSIMPVAERRDATMRLLSPMDVPLLAANFLMDEELNYGLTIVHELLHLHLWPFTQKLDEVGTIAEEQAVNAISRALVAAYSAKHKPLVPPPIGTPPVGHYL